MTSTSTKGFYGRNRTRLQGAQKKASGSSSQRETTQTPRRDFEMYRPGMLLEEVQQHISIEDGESDQDEMINQDFRLDSSSSPCFMASNQAELSQQYHVQQYTPTSNRSGAANSFHTPVTRRSQSELGNWSGSSAGSGLFHYYSNNRLLLSKYWMARRHWKDGETVSRRNFPT